MSRLFEPITIHGLALKKRLVMPPMATAKADEAGGITDAVCAYYQERARYSKIGLIITEHSYVSQQGKAHPGPGGRAFGGGLCRSDRCRPGHLSGPLLGGLISAKNPKPPRC